MDLYIEDGEALPAVKYQESDPGAGWTVATGPIDWDLYYSKGQVDVTTMVFRNEMITKFEPSWASYSDDQKKALIRWFVWPSETTAGELDALYTSDERDDFRHVVFEKMASVGFCPRESSESEKYFDIRVNDAGTLSAVEITSDTVI